MNNKKLTHWVFNPYINQVANLDITDFVKKISNVKELRTGTNDIFSFYPTSIEEYKSSLKIWDYVNGKFNVLNGYYFIFGINLPVDLYLFLRHTPKQKVKNCIALNIAYRWIHEKFENSEYIIEEQVYEPVLKKSMFYVEKYFQHIIDENSDQDYFDSEDQEFILQKKLNIKFDEVFRKEVGNSIIYPFINFNYLSHLKVFSSVMHRNNFDIEIQSCYMREDDWNHIVLKNGKDKLIRAESKKEPFIQWKRNLKFYHELPKQFINNNIDI